MKKLLYIFMFLSLFITYTIALEDITKVPTIATVDWLKKHYDDNNLVIIDVRDVKEYKKGHLKNAVSMPVFRDLFDKNLMLPKLDFLKDIFSKAGVDSNTKVVAYGDNQIIWAARLYWVLEVLGHKNVGLLNVGYGTWGDGELPISTADYQPKRKEFVPSVDNNILETQLSTYLSINKNIIIDGRPAEFYQGNKSHAKRFGHIPSALNYPGKNNYKKTKNGAVLKSFDELKQQYKNLPKDKKIILYCEDGADAALNYVMLKELGYKASVYEGSWLEWGNNFNLPIEKSINNRDNNESK
jgi:thiosulfate/3-mercaptopyruvate sulfurtransferase